MKKFFLCVLFVLLIVACQTKRDNQADIKAINNWTENYIAGIKAANVERLLSQESDDICYLPPNQPIVSGKEAARKWLVAYFDYFIPEEKLNLQQVEIKGNYAFVRGNYIWVAKAKQSGQKFKDNGKFINIFLRQPNGDWKCTHSIWNSDNPIQSQ